jgi:hypothetical protein
MGQYNLALVASAIVAGLAVLAFLAWKSRAARQARQFTAPAETLETSRLLFGPVSARYVATTTTADPLERITAHGLGMRGSCVVNVFENGMVIDRKGETSIALEKSEIHSLGLASAAIDRVVETDGLISIEWSRDGHNLSTYLRVVSNAYKAMLLEQTNLLLSKGQTND